MRMYTYPDWSCFHIVADTVGVNCWILEGKQAEVAKYRGSLQNKIIASIIKSKSYIQIIE